MAINKETIKSMIRFNTLHEEDLDSATEANKDIVSAILDEGMSDHFNESDKFLRTYKEATAEERAIIDLVLSYVCGWTMESIISKAEPMEE